MSAPSDEAARIAELEARAADLEATNQALFEFVSDLSLVYNLSLSFLREARSPDQLAATLVQTLTQQAGFTRCAVLLRHARRGDLFSLTVLRREDAAPTATEMRPADLAGTLWEACLAEGKSFHSKSLGAAAALRRLPGLSAAHFVLFPLEGRQGRVGAVWADNGDEGEPVTTERFDSLKIMAGQVALTVDNLHLNLELLEKTEDLRVQRDELNVLYTIVGKIASEHDLERLETLVLDAVLETLAVESCVLIVFQEGRLTGRCLARARGEASARTSEIDLAPHVRPGSGLAVNLAAAGILSAVHGAAGPSLDQPIRIRDRDIGLLSVAPGAGRSFGPRVAEILDKISGQIGVALEQARLYELTITDGLTNLRAHRYFQIRLAEMVRESERYKRPLSLVMIDIDHFKRINDSYGHPVGDVVLRQVARVTKSAIRDTDIAARYGGEEFALVLPETDHEGAIDLAERLRRRVEETDCAVRDGRTLRVTISLGLATVPRHASTREELIQRADAALYRAKRLGRNRVCSAEGAAGAVGREATA